MKTEPVVVSVFSFSAPAMGLHTLRLATVPLTFTTSRLFLNPSPTLAFFSRHVQPRKPSFLLRAFSNSTAVQDTPLTQTSSDSSGIITSLSLSYLFKLSFETWLILFTVASFYFLAARKAAIDFKWIRDNKEAVEINIKNRNSNADLEAVLRLYENMVTLQKVI